MPVLPLRVFLVDDHQMFREGVRRRLELESDIEVVGEAASTKEALELIPRVSPTIVTLDIRLGDANGIELARTIRNQWPQMRILILTGYDYDQYVRALVRIGIDGYLLKDAPQETLVQALREIASGGAVLPPLIASKVMKSISSTPSAIADSRPDELTIRELEVLELMHRGLRNTDIGERLSISPRTAEGHVSSIVSKLRAESRTDAVRIASETGLIR